MDRTHLITQLKQSNIHIWSRTLANNEETFVEGRIEYFENFIKILIQECVNRTIDVSLGHCEIDKDPQYESDHTIDTLNEVKAHIFEIYGIA